MRRRILMAILAITVAACSSVETETGLTSDAGVDVTTIVEFDGGSTDAGDVSPGDAVIESDLVDEPLQRDYVYYH